QYALCVAECGLPNTTFGGSPLLLHHWVQGLAGLAANLGLSISFRRVAKCLPNRSAGVVFAQHAYATENETPQVLFLFSPSPVAFFWPAAEGARPKVPNDLVGMLSRLWKGQGDGGPTPALPLPSRL